ncbi:MAG: helix-turn-helix domain-containing protein [Candidatus Binataceae bacterium]
MIAEFGSRYALAKASGIPVTTLQNYDTLGSKPGMDTLTTLARVANVDLTWLMTGAGQMRGTGQLPGAALADVVMIDQHDPKWSLAIPSIVNRIPFSRHYLERNARPIELEPKSLLAIESLVDLLDIARGDLLLIDRKQAILARDGVYLLNLPGFALRGVFNRAQGDLTIIEPRSTRSATSATANGHSQDEASASYQVNRRELLGDGRRRIASKVIGRVVWLGRAL